MPQSTGLGTPITHRPTADEDAEGGVEGELREEVAAQAPRGVVHGHGGAVEIARSEQADHAVAQILPLQQDEDQHHEDDAERGQRFGQRQKDVSRQFDRRGVRLVHLHGQRAGFGIGRGGRRGRRLLRRLLDPPPHVLQHFGDAPEASSRSPAIFCRTVHS